MAERSEAAAGRAATRITRHDFPDGFVFGGATSAYQVEGAHDADGKGQSNWDAFTAKTPYRIKDGSSGNIAIDQYNKYKEDVMLMKNLGLEAYRFSIAWSRVLPGGRISGGVNEKGVEYYNNLINFCKSQGMEPYVTIFHFDLPQCLEDEYGGFLSPNIVKDFGEFAELCFQRFGDRVKHWITLNEPWTFAHNSYVAGSFPPCHGGARPIQVVKRRTTQVAQFSSSTTISTMSAISSTIEVPLPVMPQYRGSWFPESTWANNVVDFGSTLTPYTIGSGNITKREKKAIRPPGDAGTEPYIVAHHLIIAHAVAVDIYRTKYQNDQKGEIGITNMTTWFEPLEDTDEDREAASRALEFMWGWFMRPIVHGDYPDVMKEYVKSSRLPEFSDDEKELIKGSYDFIGLNYYTTCYVANVPQDSVARPTYYTDQQLGQTPEKNGQRIGACPGSCWLFIVPSGLQKLLLHTKENYDDPLIYITENGMSEHNNQSLTVEEARRDLVRVKFYEDHLDCVKAAIAEGVKVKAFFLWSMFDNYEWGDGYTVRFGIYFVDFDQDLARHPKYSAIWWRRFMDKTTDVARLKKEAE